MRIILFSLTWVSLMMSHVAVADPRPDCARSISPLRTLAVATQDLTKENLKARLHQLSIFRSKCERDDWFRRTIGEPLDKLTDFGTVGPWTFPCSKLETGLTKIAQDFKAYLTSTNNHSLDDVAGGTSIVSKSRALRCYADLEKSLK